MLCDIDVYVVVPRLNATVFGDLVRAAEEAAQNIANETATPWKVETRRGPFKAPPSQGLGGQIHLLCEDQESLVGLGDMTFLNWCNGAILLDGIELRSLKPGTFERIQRNCAEQCRSELKALREAVAEEVVPYKEWNFDEEAGIIERRCPIINTWTAFVFARHVSKVAALFPVLVDDPFCPESKAALNDLYSPCPVLAPVSLTTDTFDSWWADLKAQLLAHVDAVLWPGEGWGKIGG